MKLMPEGRAGWVRMGVRVIGVFVVLGLVLLGLLYFVTTGPGRTLTMSPLTP